MNLLWNLLRRAWLHYKFVCSLEDEMPHKRLMPPPSGYYQVELPGDVFETLEKLILGIGVMPMAKERLKTSLLCAKDIALPLGYLEWGEVEREAKRQGVGICDIIYDGGIVSRSRGSA